MEVITIPISEYKAILARIELLEKRIDELLAENTALKNKVAKLTQQIHGKKKRSN